MILKVFIFPFLGVFNILRLLWNLFCFRYGEEQIFTDHLIEVRKNILCRKMISLIRIQAHYGTTLFMGLLHQHKARLVATWI